MSKLDAVRYVDHVGIVVKDLDAAVACYRAVLGAVPVVFEDAPEMGLRAAMLSIGETRLELLTTVRDDTAVSNFLRTRGEGMHHIAFRVGDVQAKLSECAGMALDLVDRTPRKGVSGTVGFMHPKAMHGVLVEFVQDFILEHRAHGH